MPKVPDGYVRARTHLRRKPGPKSAKGLSVWVAAGAAVLAGFRVRDRLRRRADGERPACLRIALSELDTATPSAGPRKSGRADRYGSTRA